MSEVEAEEMEVNGTDAANLDVGVDVNATAAECAETPDQEKYFSSYEDLNVHRLMLEDKPRTIAYKDAIEAAGDVFKGKVVMDVGAGTGILSLFCAKAGAKKVYAVEASSLAKVLPKVAAQNGFSDIIEVIHSRVENLVLEKDSVDIIVSEWMGFYLLHESMLDSVIHARDAFLKKDGLLFPTSCNLYGAPCRVPDLWKEQVEFWKKEQYGFDLSALGQTQVKLKPEIHKVESENLLAEPQLLWKLDLKTVTQESLQVLTDRRFFTIDDDGGEMQAMAIWFDVAFPFPEEDNIELSTAPWDEETHWKQTVILLPEPVQFEAGDIMGWEFSMEKETNVAEHKRTYKLQLELLLDENLEHPVPCECGSAKCEIIKHFLSTQGTENVTNS